MGKEGGPQASQNALKTDFPHQAMMTAWISPAQYNQVTHNGKKHHVIIVPDKDATVVNVGGNHSIRGGTLGQKCYNPDTATRERLTSPMIRVNGKLTPASWDLVTEAMADISKYVIAKFGEHAWAIKMYSYQYFENTYAITKLGMTSIGTPSIAPHDKCANTNDATGLDDAGIDSFASSYQDWGDCEVAFLSGVDPYETKTTLFTQWMMPGDKKMIFVTPHKTMGVAWAERRKGAACGCRSILAPTACCTWLWRASSSKTTGRIRRSSTSGSPSRGKSMKDTAAARATPAGSGAPPGAPGRATGRTTRSSSWRRRNPSSRLPPRSPASRPKTSVKATEWIAKPVNGKAPKTSFMCEKGNYWSNNYMNTASFAALGLICGAGNRPGRMISRGGGHQRGMMGAGGGSGWLSPEKYPGRRKKALNLDRWLMAGEVKFAWVFGTTWVAAMMASDALGARMKELTVGNPHQITSLDRAAIFEVLKKRVDSGGMVMANSDIYPCEPIGTEFADFVLPAATWGEDDFTRCNSERRLRLYSKFYDAPGDAKPDWWAVAKFADKMGYTADGSYNWQSSNDVFEEAARFGRGGVLNYQPLVVKAKEMGL